MALFIYWIVQIITWLINIYVLLIVVDALLTWFPGASNSWLGRFVGKLVNPFLNYFNWAHIGMLGFGPIIAMVVLFFIQYGVEGIGQVLINMVS